MFDELDTREMAEILYKMSEDMDSEDYADTKEKEINDLDEAIFQLKAIAENDLNKDYWRTLYRALNVALERQNETVNS